MCYTVMLPVPLEHIEAVGTQAILNAPMPTGLRVRSVEAPSEAIQPFHQEAFLPPGTLLVWADADRPGREQDFVDALSRVLFPPTPSSGPPLLGSPR